LQITKTTMEQMRNDLRPDAEKRIRNYLLVEELGRAEGVVVEDGDVHFEIDRIIAAQADQAAARSELSTNQMHDRIKNNLFVKALFDGLIAKVTEGQTPVAVVTSSTLPAADEAIVTSAEPEAASDETPKIITATH
jgi:trigger factor